MKVELSPGEFVKIGFAETDGEFEIHFDTKEHPLCVIVKETDAMPGNVKGEALEVLYEERFEVPGQAEEGPEDAPAGSLDTTVDDQGTWVKG